MTRRIPAGSNGTERNVTWYLEVVPSHDETSELLEYETLVRQIHQHGHIRSARTCCHRGV